MIDRNRLIEAWEIFRDSNPYEICSGCEFRAISEPEYCMGQMVEDTIALLDECDTQLQYRDDHIALYQAEINRLEALLKQEAVAKCDRCLFVARDRLRKVIETDEFKCPACKERIAGRMTDGTVLLETPGDDLPDYCPHCGQRLDWDIVPNDVAEGR